ncbi:MAG: hypothetical protein A2Y77_09990 [Planctomycetes bacterium RBG_13_62_9]|nr:MAG: hypothetical protein A2Y77_09990 [Planctomycetes bacterium RBG_13_62_9]
MLVQLVTFAFNVYAMGLIIYGLCSWLPQPGGKRVRDWLRPWYEPVLERVRRVVKPVRIGSTNVDFSALVVLIGIVIVRKITLALLLMPY